MYWLELEKAQTAFIGDGEFPEGVEVRRERETETLWSLNCLKKKVPGSLD